MHNLLAFRSLVPIARLATLVSLLALLWIGLGPPAAPVQAAVLFVDTLNDDGGGSLRQAITDANGSSDDADTIVIHVTGTITLASNLPTITADLTIQGPGAGQLTVSGQDAHRPFTIDTGATVEIAGLTIADGNQAGGTGGGLFNRGVLTLTNVTVTRNRASFAGGGIRNDGTLRLINTTVQGNDAFQGDGGAIANTGDLLLLQSTVSGNSAVNSGGILTSGGSLSLIQSTVADNAALSNHGGGLSSFGGAVTLTGSIVAGNSSPAADDIDGTVDAGSTHNLIGDAASSGGLTNGDNNNIVGVDPATVLDLTLTDNGGPTLTHALLPGSPALDKGDPTTSDPFDQRGPGFARVVNSAPDIGAFELQNSASLVVDSDADTIADDGLTTLREAITTANADPTTADTITFAFPLPPTITLSSSLPPITADLTIQGPGADQLTVSGLGAHRPFEIAAGATVEISGLTIADGFNATGGGGILNAGTLTLTAATVSLNSADTSGAGGIHNLGTLTVTNSTVRDNTGHSSPGVGGGIDNSGTLTLTNTTVSGNFSEFGDAGIQNFGALIVSNSTVSNNVAPFGIAGIGNALTGMLTLTSTIVAGNTRFGGSIPRDISGAVDPASTHNLIGDGTGITGISDGANGNLIGDATTPIDPLLGPLADNGGPTLTHALLPGSPAIDKGDPTTSEPFDQRGLLRIVGPAPDIGAFELQAVPEPGPPPPVDSDGDLLYDDIEQAFGLDPFTPDTDGDGLSDYDEIANFTKGTNPDTDGDGVNDGDEVAQGSDPLDPNDPTPAVEPPPPPPPPPPPAADLIFTDGFESGDTSAWTSTFGGGTNTGSYNSGAGLSSSGLRNAQLGAVVPIEEAVATIDGSYSAIFTYDAATGDFFVYRPDGPAVLNTLTELRVGEAFFIQVTSPTLRWEQGVALTDARSVALGSGFNFVGWTGPELLPLADAIGGLGTAVRAAFVWDPDAQEYQSWFRDAPAFLNTLEVLPYSRAIWLLMDRPASFQTPARGLP